MRRKSRALVAVALVVAVGAAWLALRATGLTDGSVGASRDGDGDGAEAPGALAREAELAAAAREEEGRLWKFPGIRVDRRGAGSVVGKVTLYMPGAGEKPLAGARIQLAATRDGKDVRAEGETGDDGTFAIAPVPALEGYALVASHAPHRDLSLRGLAVLEGRVLDVGTLVFGAPTTLSGSVVDSHGAPVGRALVSVERDSAPGGRVDVMRQLRELAVAPGALALGYSAADGTFSLKGLPPGRYLVRVTHAGHASSFVSGVYVTVDGDAAGVRVVLEPGAGFEGRVTDADGRPIAGAAVVAMPFRTENPKAFERNDTRADQDGHYVLDTLAPGTMYFVEAHAEGRAPNGMLRRTDGLQPLDFVLTVSGRVEGTVSDAKTHAPIASAEVLLITGFGGSGVVPLSVVADSSGRYVFEHATPGPIIVFEARAAGYARTTSGYDAKAPRAVKAGETLVLDVAMPPGGVVSGHVRDEDGRPIPYVSVAAWIPRSRWDGENAALTDSSGTYRLTGLRPETWTLAITAPGYASPVDDQEVKVEIRETNGTIGEVVRDFTLRAGAVIVGRVTTDAGESASGARVAVLAADEKTYGDRVRDLVAVADGAGAYRVAGAPSGIDLLVEAQSNDGIRSRSPPFRAAPGEVKTVDVVLRAPSKVIGRVVDAAGRPVGKARVRFGHVEADDLGRLGNSFNADQFLGPKTFLSDGGGQFVVDRVPAGAAILRVDADGFSPWFRRDLTVPAEGDLTGVVATLDGAKSVAGRVIAADTNRPIAGAWVYAVAKGAEGAPADNGRVQPLETMETRADGSFALHGLPPGPLEVGVSVALGYKNTWEDKANARKEVPAGTMDLEFRLQPQAPPSPENPTAR